MKPKLRGGRLHRPINEGHSWTAERQAGARTTRSRQLLPAAEDLREPHGRIEDFKIIHCSTSVSSLTCPLVLHHDINVNSAAHTVIAHQSQQTLLAHGLRATSRDHVSRQSIPRLLAPSKCLHGQVRPDINTVHPPTPLIITVVTEARLPLSSQTGRAITSCVLLPTGSSARANEIRG